MDNQNTRLNAVRSRSDPRDRNYSKSNKLLREHVDLRSWASPIESQEDAGDCVGHAVANAYEFLLKQHRPGDFVDLSRLFIYYNARYIDDPDSITDSGTYIRSALRGLKLYGVCDETVWPYDLAKVNTQPDEAAFAATVSRRISSYYRLREVDDISDAVNNNRPVVFGLEIFDRFYDADQSNPIVQMPYGNEENLGGHAMCVLGYDFPKRLFLVKNSFGTDWGDQGYCWIPFNYVRDYGYDIWTFDLPEKVVPAPAELLPE